ncbi:hypothetical protein SRHO_G00318100 [Serrasalmus rhombeus]
MLRLGYPEKFRTAQKPEHRANRAPREPVVALGKRWPLLLSGCDDVIRRLTLRFRNARAESVPSHLSGPPPQQRLNTAPSVASRRKPASPSFSSKGCESLARGPAAAALWSCRASRSAVDGVKAKETRNDIKP